MTAYAMQAIAIDANYSECVFISSPDTWSTADYRFRFFSPTCEVDMCGHATLAGIGYIHDHNRAWEKKENYTIQTNNQLIDCRIESNGCIFIKMWKWSIQTLTLSSKYIADILWISPEKNLIDSIALWSVWATKLLIWVNDKNALDQLEPDMEKIKIIDTEIGSRWIYVYSEDRSDSSIIHARQFNPTVGINEDPITWVAAWALWVYYREIRKSTTPFSILQWSHMNMPGTIDVTYTSSGEVSIGWYVYSNS